MANKKKDNPLVRVTVSLDPEDYRSFEWLAKRNDRSTAYLIRQAMKQYLSELKSQEALPIRKAD